MACNRVTGRRATKILIVSDLHANLEAVGSLPTGYDELWVLGDLVNYGPNPAEVIEFVRANASLVVRGNHDHSVGYEQDPRCSARFRRLAEETGRFTRSVIHEDQKRFLRSLPLTAQRVIAGVKFFLCHAVPASPLYEYVVPDSARWQQEAAHVPAGVLLVGHTHLPFQRTVASHVVVNPGSVGQPKHGAPRACYAIWEDGALRLESSAYPCEETVAKVRALPVPSEVRADLEAVLRTGSAV